MPNGATVVDDYAHHPSEMKATLSTAKEMHFDRILCAFQPHTYTRTKALFPEFVDALKQCDQAILAPIYAAREQNTIGIYSSDIAKEVPGAVSFDTFDEIADYLRKTQARTTSSSPWAPATSTRSARCSSSQFSAALSVFAHTEPLFSFQRRFFPCRTTCRAIFPVSLHASSARTRRLPPPTRTGRRFILRRRSAGWACRTRPTAIPRPSRAAGSTA
ncbi:MAG: glutamate ligase domain-containing protein [Butyricicoccaceae bacterium]